MQAAWRIFPRKNSTKTDLVVLSAIQQLIRKNLTILDNSGIRPTPRGLIVNGEVIGALL